MHEVLDEHRFFEGELVADEQIHDKYDEEVRNEVEEEVHEQPIGVHLELVALDELHFMVGVVVEEAEELEDELVAYLKDEVMDELVLLAQITETLELFQQEGEEEDAEQDLLEELELEVK